MSERANIVVVGIDGSVDSNAALKWAEHYAISTGASLRLVATWMWPQTYGAPLAFDNFQPDELTHTVLEKATTELTIPAERVETICRQGGAGPILVAESEDAELLVVGSHGHSVVTTVLIGSVSAYCVHHASCPVVVVR